MINKILRKLHLKHKLIMVNMLITGIVFLIAVTIILLIEIISVRASIFKNLKSQAGMMADGLNASLAFNDLAAARETLATFKSSTNVECAIVYSRDGAVFASYWRPDIKVKVTPRYSPKGGSVFSLKTLSLFHGIELNGRRLGAIYIRSDLKTLHYVMIRHLVVILIIMPLIIIIAFKLITRWQGIVTEPLMHLFQVMKLVSWEKNYSLRAQVYNEDEIGSLARGFNAMLEQIQERDTKLMAEIAERKEAEERYRQANEEWDRTFDAIVDPVMIVDTQYRIIKANTAMAAKLGVSPAQAKGLVCYSSVHGGLESPSLCPHSELLADGKPHSVEIYEERLGGYFIISVSPLFTPQGEIYGSVHYARDISERRKAEEYLKESEIRFKTIFNNNTDGLVVVDIESRKFVLCNPMICRMLGYEEEEINSLTVVDIHSSEDLPYVMEQFGKMVRGEIEIVEKLRVKRKDGTFFHADIKTSPLALGGKEYLLGVFRDVTERELAKDALKDSERKLKAIVYGSPVPQFVLDRDHSVIYWNYALAQLTGISEERMIGKKNHWMAFYPSERQSMADLLLDGSVGKIEDMYKGKCRRSDLVANAYEVTDYFPTIGREGKWLHFTAAEIADSKGKVIGVMETLEDVTGLKLAEESIRALNEGLELKVEEKTKQLMEAREELVRKEKLAVLGQLSGFVGHELRNPLGVMNNAVYYLMNVAPNTDETMREYLEIIKGEIGNSQRIINDLLEFSRTKKPQAKAVTVRELIDEGLVRCEIPQHVQLRMELPDTLPRIKVDPLQMGQVFQNLITNAVQAMPGGGAVRISARRVQGSRLKDKGSQTDNFEHGTLNVEPDADFLEISVEDTGEGISPENMKKLFQPLFTTKARGIGLGLLVCKNLTDANGGAIGVESEEGKGTRFVILLPMEG